MTAAAERLKGAGVARVVIMQARVQGYAVFLGDIRVVVGVIARGAAVGRDFEAEVAGEMQEYRPEGRYAADDDDDP